MHVLRYGEDGGGKNDDENDDHDAGEMPVVAIATADTAGTAADSETCM